MEHDVNILPPLQPGQIVIRDEHGRWQAIWPKKRIHMTPTDRWFLGIVSMLSLTLLSISVVMLWTTIE